MPPLLFILALVGGMAIVVALTHISLLIISFSKWEREPRAYQCDNKITTKSDESPAAKQQSVGAATDLSALIDTIRAEGRANRAEEKREDDAKTFRELVTIVLIGATLFAVCWQVYEMVQVYDPIRAQADEAKRSADAAAKQAESAERAFIQAQRAWIGPRNATIVGDVVVGKPVEIVFAYENSGHEPGVDFRAYAEPIRMSGDDDAKVRGVIQKNLEACRASVAWEGGSVVFPSVGGFGSGYLTGRNLAGYRCPR